MSESGGSPSSAAAELYVCLCGMLIDGKALVVFCRCKLLPPFYYCHLLQCVQHVCITYAATFNQRKYALSII